MRVLYLQAIDQHRHRVLSFAHYSLRARENAEDVTQEVFIKLWQHWQKIDFNEIDFSDTLSSRGKNLHWETLVKVREEWEQVWVLVGMDLARNSLDAVSVFVLENSELVMINVDGDFDSMIEFVLHAFDSCQDRDAS